MILVGYKLLTNLHNNQQKTRFLPAFYPFLPLSYLPTYSSVIEVANSY